MNKLPLSIWSAAITSLLVACSQEPVVRTIELTAQPVTPSASTHAEGTKLHVTLENVEPLLPGKRLIVWAVGATDAMLVALGAVTPGEIAELDPPAAGIALNAIRTIEITEEAEAAALPSLRSGITLVRGPFPGKLEFEVPLADFAGAQGSATIEDDELDVTATGLPALPNGFEYVVWLRFENTSPGETHDHLRVLAGEHGDPEPITNQGMMRIGALPQTGAQRFSARDELFEAVECRITIESLQGIADPSPCTTLRGMVELPEGSGDPDGHLH
jgi:hypothetical protein